MRYVAIDVEEVLRETAAAFLFLIDGNEVWVPKSIMENDKQVDVGDTDVAVDVEYWKAKKIEEGDDS